MPTLSEPVSELPRPNQFSALLRRAEMARLKAGFSRARRDACGGEGELRLTVESQSSESGPEECTVCEGTGYFFYSLRPGGELAAAHPRGILSPSEMIETAALLEGVSTIALDNGVRLILKSVRNGWRFTCWSREVVPPVGTPKVKPLPCPADRDLTRSFATPHAAATYFATLLRQSGDF